MERIGIAASKIAKGNFFLYHFFVILITVLFSLLVFFISGACIVIVLFAVAYISNNGHLEDIQAWFPLISICLICLGVTMLVLAICAVLKNIKIKGGP